MAIESWKSQEELEELARKHRTQEITEGVIQSVGTRKLPVTDENGRTETKEVEVAFFMLEGGIMGYCPAHEFSDRSFRSLVGFVGQIKEFVIDRIELEERIAIVSVRKADERKREAFWTELKSLEERNELQDHTFEGIINGVNPDTNRIFVRINGADCFMSPRDWAHGRTRDLQEEAERGKKIAVKVLRMDEERNLIQVSRRHAMDDPFDKLEALRNMDAVAGKVSEVHAIHGIFIQLDLGLEVKGIKPRYLEEPIAGDIVTCKVRTIDRERRHAKVVIVGYPRGKKKRKDAGSFLFS
ncbi:hypothetical protein [Gracilibacillus sp. YIM 98692]|uniref:hypothetical protein n=1 Tax=Gracilibacillus sp. YIM 98692 TaxID=2663532 RepID=UPI0013D6D43A|nr:hypothetical protein [Gracilibacillus sp. YIM 98692]